MRKVQIVPKCKMEEMRKIFNDYFVELSQFDPDIKFDENGVPIYKWFNSYWEDKKRYPFYFVVDNKIAGFALVRELENLNYEMAEFYVCPDYRNNGNSLWFALEIVKMFNGKMEISTRHTNPRAVKFWGKVANNFKFDTHTDDVWFYWVVEVE